MLHQRKIIFFELNEVPHRVYRHYADAHPDSAIARLLKTATVIDTISEDAGHLSPWITWPTVHRGVTNTRHLIRSLGQPTEEADREFPPVWSLLAAAGKSVGVFGSLHTYPLPANVDDYAFYVPDTFAAGPETFPAKLTAFQSFNLRMVDVSGRNVSRSLPIGDGMELIRRAPGLGLRLQTILKIVRQLISERLVPDRAGRRRTIQSLLSFDLFLRALTVGRPDIAFFFTNHVASSQHRYWPATFPGDYRDPQQDAAWRARFVDEIDYAMGEADAMLGELMTFAEHNDYILMSSGSMGQCAVDGAGTRVQIELHLREPEALMRLIGIRAGQWIRRRTMEPLYTFVFTGGADQCFCDGLSRLTIAGSPIEFERLNDGAVSVAFGQHDLVETETELRFNSCVVTFADVGLANVKIDDESGSAAYHVPEGCLLIYDPRAPGSAGEAAPIPTTAIAPMLLANFDVPLPTYMSANEH